MEELLATYYKKHGNLLLV